MIDTPRRISFLKEHIDIETPIREVIHRMVEWQTLSILVTENGRPVGLVGLSDLCDEVIAEMHRNRSGESV
ncbi:MAG: CBS domain-containing protein [Acidobacteria bacterium]|nr:CBS domain-containing protein [Acidobacteriota bacterium]